MTWISRNGIEIRDLVPADLRRRWVERGDCPDRDLYALLRERVRAHPGREAVIDDERTLDYAGLDREVRRIAAALAGAGLGPGDIVGIRLPNGWRALVAELAVVAVGAVALPYPAGPGSRDTRSLLGRSRATAAIFADQADAAVAAELPHLREVFTFGSGSLDEAPYEHSWEPSPIDPDGPARILVTSGSQAEPKMIAYSHNAMGGGRANYVRALHRGDGPMRGLLLVKTATSYGSCAVVSLTALGSTLILADRFDAAEALRMVARHRPSHLFGVPTMLRRLAGHPATPEEDLSSLQAVVSSGAPLPEVTAAACRQRFGCQVITIYGSSDGINCHTARTGDVPGTGTPDPAVADIRIVDEHGVDAPTGEIWARGPMTPLSYVADAELDARYRTPEGWVRSGDLGTFDQHGRLHVLGRLKQVVSRGGYQISPAEVERELSAHPAIVDVACVPVPDADLGERMCACISQAAAAPELTLADITEFLATERGLERRKLPEYLLRLPELPLAATGKVCRRTVTAMAAELEKETAR
ncbi:Acyl-CoA synthetase (AMP-forming)/AMP-acid ligase II [Saccharopolyspora antimicrobica]|uniref:Acyl-CoA synthetase (AMP-forming)/AMP-acid ligase II n=1 Tax=Saccharopolyspora antimicrobica TaxID=455193 RepID=A0A1I4RZV0_9PSEU|nr:fatty acid--CoA ligase family protein [Saccharopolyspora antimicrobica]RKT89213.1 acyl-CoA synthetase (AMP-forming)/AMP-acid ligase II [Saccharopolyspora antimicrobica]SFM57711.1 Acyl-CoA synthetase (AMP-forming)/AMP-acid ligase II [Saccharopolyspora antimicrobica]